MFFRHLLPLFCCQLLLPGITLASSIYQTNEAFLSETFTSTPPSMGVIWIKGKIRTRAEEILGHDYPLLRVRYWRATDRTAWILDEIGKEKPITAGIVISAGKIERIRVLAFRESRGAEIRHDFFTHQFTGTALDAQGRLDSGIDSITGATLSVRAMHRMARLALYFHQLVMAR